MAERRAIQIDPAVAAILGAGDQRQTERHQTARQRKEARRQAARVRITLDVPDWLKARLLAVAAEREVSASTLAAFLLIDGLRQVSRGALPVPRTPSDSPRFGWLVEVPEDEPAW